MSMAYPAKINCNFCLDETFTPIRVTILTNLTINVSWWLEKWNIQFIHHFGLAVAVNLKQLPFFFFVKFHVNFLLLKMGTKKERPSDQMKRPGKQRSGKTPHRCCNIQFCLLGNTSHHSTDFSLTIKVGKGIE